MNAQTDSNSRCAYSSGGGAWLWKGAEHMRRKVETGLIEADHAACSIVVHVTVIGEGEPVEHQEKRKRIKLGGGCARSVIGYLYKKNNIYIYMYTYRRGI